MNKTIKVDTVVIAEVNKILNRRLIKVIKDRVELILLGVEVFKDAQAEGKTTDDCLVAALDYVTTDEESWLRGLDKFYTCTDNGQPINEALERAINIATSNNIEPSVGLIGKTGAKLNNLGSRIKSLTTNAWQTIKSEFGNASTDTDTENTEGGEEHDV